MSLVDVSHPGTPGYDELVPSRYALRVGDIDVMVISDGVLPITAVTVATNAAPADLSAWLKDMYLPPEVLDWPLNVAVVRSGGKTILIDSGLGTEFPDFPRAGQLAMRLHGRRDQPVLRDRRGAHPSAHGPHRRAAGRRAAKPAAAGPASPPGVGRGRVLGGARLLAHRHAVADSGRASADRHAVPGRVPQPAAAVRDGVRGGARRAAPPHRRSHPRPQHRPHRVRRRGTDIRR